MRTPTRLGVLTGATALSLVLAACSGSSSDDAGPASGTHSATTSTSGASPAAVGDGHDAADVSFAQDMVVHHRAAVEMARLAATRASTPQVEDLAARIEAAQGPEVDQMTSWLEAWGEPVPAGPMAGMGHPSTSASAGSTSSRSASSSPTGGATGMMTGEQVDQLGAATGTAFDRMFLQLMTTHHRGAIAMARTEQAHGSDPRAVALARSITASQTAEVTEMGQLLQGLGS